MPKQVCRESLLWVVILSVCVGCFTHLLYAAPPDVPIAIENGKLTAMLDQLPLQAVLDKLQQLTGMRYVLPPAEAKRAISVRVHALPLVEALREICAPLNYVVRTDADGNLRSVVILGTHDRAPQAAVPPPSSRTVDPMPMTPPQTEKMLVIYPTTAEPMPIVPAREERMPIIFPRTPVPMSIEPARESMGMPLNR